eukprot:scaffold31825_cov60-Phaeocystis_antarctica.AAC.2
MLEEVRPHLERTEAAAELGPKVHRPRVARREAALVSNEVVWPLREGAQVRVTVAHEHAATVVVDVQPFVEIKRERRRPLHAPKARPYHLAQHRRRAERTVDVEPETVLLGKRRNAVEVIDGTHVDRARSADHQEWRETSAAVLLDHCAQRLEVHREVGPHRHEPQRVRAEPQNVEGARDARVCALRHVADQRAPPDASLRSNKAGLAAAVEAEHPVSRGLERDDSGHRGARDQQRTAVGWEAHHRAAPLQHLLLHVDGRVLARAAVGHAARATGAVHPAKEARVRVANAVWQQRCKPSALRLARDALARQRLVERFPHGGRQGRPGAALVGCLKPVNTCVEERVRIRSERGPALWGSRVERS